MRSLSLVIVSLIALFVVVLLLPLFIYKEGYKEVWLYLNPPYGTSKPYGQNILKDKREVYGNLQYASGPVVRAQSSIVEIKIRRFNTVSVGLDSKITKYYSLQRGEVVKPDTQTNDVIGVVYGLFQGKLVAYEVWVE